jgi:capsular exopolysaccharide synthesis family protein
VTTPPTRYEFRPGRGLPFDGGGTQEDLKLGDVWAGLLRNRWVILGCAALGLAAGEVYTLRVTPVYDAFVTIRIQERQLNLSEIYHTMSTGIAGSDLGTEMEVLGSRALREDAASLLGLQVSLIDPQRVSRQELLHHIAVAPDAEQTAYRLLRRSDGRFEIFAADSTHPIGASAPDGAVELPGVRFTLTPKASDYNRLVIGVQSFSSAIDGLSGGLRVDQPRRDAYIVTVGYSSTDPLLARDVPNAITTSYMARRQSLRTAEARSTVKFLQEQLGRVDTELAAAEGTFRLFQERYRVLDPGVETSSEVARLVLKESERSGVEAEREALARSLAEIEASAAAEPGGPSPYRRLIGLPFLLRNQAASALLSTLISAENDRAALVGRTARDPDVEVLTARIEDLEKQLHSITTTYLAGLNNQVASLNTALGHFQRELDAIPGKQLQFVRLDRRVKALEEVHGLLEGRLKEGEIAEAAKDASVQIVDTAAAPSGPSSPNAFVNGLAALALGLLVGIVTATVREYRDKSVHSRKDIVIATGVPVLGLIPRISRSNGRIALITEKLRLSPGTPSRGKNSSKGAGYTFLTAMPASTDHRPSGPSTSPAVGQSPPSVHLKISGWGRGVAEAYGLLQTNLAFAHSGPPIRVVVVTSPLAEDGKTTCATNLAITLALRGSKTLLIDADLRRGVVHTAFDAPRAPGLSELLSRSAPPSDVIRTIKVGPENAELHFLTTGTLPVNPSGLLESSFEALLATVRERFDSVIIDSPPVNIISDASVLGLHADGVLVVARSGVTQSGALASATEQLTRVGVPVLGVVLNDIDFRREVGYDASYRYYADSRYLSATQGSSG